MTTPVNELRGITEETTDKLKELKIINSDQLLQASITPGQRKILAQQVNLTTQELLRLANGADLSRIRGVGGAFSNLLEKAGVDTVKELAMRRSDNLYIKISEINNNEKIVKKAPSEAQVEAWVAEAKTLPRGLEY